jgi:hypothetical protein
MPEHVHKGRGSSLLKINGPGSAGHYSLHHPLARKRLSDFRKGEPIMRTKLSTGTRKLFRLGLGIAVLVGLINAWFAVPNVWLTYQVQSPGAAPVRVTQCGEDDVREYFYRRTADGAFFNIDLCFLAVDNKQLKFIPYATDTDGLSWIELKHSPQVGAYTRSVARSFTIPQADYPAALATWRKAKWQARLESLGKFALGCGAAAALFLFAAWLMRKPWGIAARKRIARAM